MSNGHQILAEAGSLVKLFFKENVDGLPLLGSKRKIGFCLSAFGGR
jgi:hypothetical protein